MVCTSNPFPVGASAVVRGYHGVPIASLASIPPLHSFVYAQEITLRLTATSGVAPECSKSISSWHSLSCTPDLKWPGQSKAQDWVTMEGKEPVLAELHESEHKSRTVTKEAR